MPATMPVTLKLRPYGASIDEAKLAATVTSLTGKGPTRQALEILVARFGRQKMSVAEYYEYGLWRPQLARQEKAAFVSDVGSVALNLRLSPMNRTNLSGFTSNKLLTGLALRAAGLPMQTPRAVFGTGFAIRGVEQLGNAAEIAAWLRRDGSLPAFGKPLHESLCIGAASLLFLEDNGKRVRFGDGKTVGIEVMAQEIASQFSRGYLFEPLIRQHPDVEALTGPAVGALRVVTLREPDGIQLLYVAQRLPAVGAMTDGAQLDAPFSEALVDAETGGYIRVQNMGQMATERLERSNVTGKAFAGVTLPFVREALEVAKAAHGLLTGAGVLGFDIALSTDGPLINEINSNPFHSIYQRSSDRGLLNPEFRPRIEAAIALSRSRKK